MKQVLISGKGAVEVLDVPVPGPLANSVLVRNVCSLISKGTEGAAVSSSAGWMGMFEKALHSRDRLKDVWNLAQMQGVASTWEAVSRKLHDYSAVGYSSAGEVIELNGDLPFRVGDRVACIGTGFAMHAEFVTVPCNLVAPIPQEVRFEEACFGALACIAMQGIRRLELTPGEWVGVIGLGLIGQITAQLLLAMGYRAIGIDVSTARASQARATGSIDAWGSSDIDSARRVSEFTHGRGLDGVILAAATSSDQPVNLAFDLCRQRGRVVVIGDVGLALDRAKMYRKEIELRLSCSYGPGRYDSDYEIKAVDYPLAFARWTEGRNLGYALDVMRSGKLNLSPLITSTFRIEQAVDAYRTIKQDPDALGVLLQYSRPDQRVDPDLAPTVAIRHDYKLAAAPIKLGLIGTGGFAKNVHLPNLKRLSRLFQIAGVANRNGAPAEILARRYGIPLVSSDHRALLDDPTIDAVLIATRHASHASIVRDALAAGKHVFVEKPMCISEDEGKQIVTDAGASGLVVRVGFNRRFSPFLSALREAVGTEGLRALTCRVNIGGVHNDWSNTPDEGGRLLGEGVHFFDLCNWFMASNPLQISAMVAGDPVQTNPNVIVQIEYPDHCLANVVYLAIGDPKAGKEFMEAFGNGRAAFVDDYRDFRAFGSSTSVKRADRGDKGHLGELMEFAAAIQGRSYPILGADATAGLVATWMARAVYRSHLEGRAISLLELQLPAPIRSRPLEGEMAEV